MQHRLSHRLHAQEQQGIDLSPLIDVVFILLIFFIVTTVFVQETGVEVDKPKAVSAAELERNVILIAITDNREVVFNGGAIGVAGVRAVVSANLGPNKQAVVIQVDKRVPAELLVQVIDEAKLAGAAHVNLATQFAKH